MIITIDGSDGAGKTTIAKMLAEAINAHYIAKPIYSYFHFKYPNLDWKSMADKQMKEEFTSKYSNLDKAEFVCKFLYFIKDYAKKNEIYIIDRGVLSCYIYNGNKETNEFFKHCLSDGIGFDLSIFLEATKETRRIRLFKRNLSDDDLTCEILSLDDHAAIEFGKDNNMNVAVIKTDKMSIEEVFNSALSEVNKHITAVRTKHVGGKQ